MSLSFRYDLFKLWLEMVRPNVGLFITIALMVVVTGHTVVLLAGDSALSLVVMILSAIPLVYAVLLLLVIYILEVKPLTAKLANLKSTYCVQDSKVLYLSEYFLREIRHTNGILDVPVKNRSDIVNALVNRLEQELKPGSGIYIQVTVDPKGRIVDCDDHQTNKQETKP